MESFRGDWGAGDWDSVGRRGRGANCFWRGEGWGWDWGGANGSGSGRARGEDVVEDGGETTGTVPVRCLGVRGAVVDTGDDEVEVD